MFGIANASKRLPVTSPDLLIQIISSFLLKPVVNSVDASQDIDLDFVTGNN